MMCCGTKNSALRWGIDVGLRVVVVVEEEEPVVVAAVVVVVVLEWDRFMG